MSPSITIRSARRPLAWLALIACSLAVLVWMWSSRPAQAADGAMAVPPPAADDARAAGSPQVAVLAGGCFWGTQGVFEHVKGVLKVVAGYSGGERSTAQYETVSTGTTGHAESIQITYDPGQITYGELLRVFFSVAHDPTELDRQGPDTGTQYRSEIFYASAGQRRVAEAYIAQLDRAGVFAHKIVTRVDPLKDFYRAEDYHQDFLAHNPNYIYIVFNDLPKIANLKRVFPALYRDQPVLIAAAR